MNTVSRRDLLMAAAGVALGGASPSDADAASPDAGATSRTRDIAMEGGGAKAIAFVGAVGELLSQGYKPRRLIGTSGGAIFATCQAAGYDAKELEALLTERVGGSLRFASFIEPPPSPGVPPDLPPVLKVALSVGINGLFSSLAKYQKTNKAKATKVARYERHLRSTLALLATGAVADDGKFLEYIEGLLRKKGFKSDVLLKDFHEKTKERGIQLSLIATDLTSQRVLVLNHHTAPDLPVVSAVRMSMGIPLVWREVEWKAGWGTYRGKPMREGEEGHFIVDGGVLSNFPLKYLLDRRHREADGVLGPFPGEGSVTPIGLLLDEGKDPPTAVASARKERFFERLPVYRSVSRLTDTLTTAWDMDAIEERGAGKQVCRIGVKGVDTLDFEMTDDQVGALVKSGREAVREYLAALGR